jgi:hypothetical protein
MLLFQLSQTYRIKNNTALTVTVIILNEAFTPRYFNYCSSIIITATNNIDASEPLLNIIYQSMASTGRTRNKVTASFFQNPA